MRIGLPTIFRRLRTSVWNGNAMNNFTWFWQHLPQNMNPVIFRIGSFSLQYYGLMYLIAFGLTYALASYRLRKEKRFGISGEQLGSLVTSMIVGVLVGGRLGYVLFYNLSYYLKNPLEIILPFSMNNGFRFTGIAGMSFHGGLIAVILFAWIYTRRQKLDFLKMADLIIPAMPLGYTFGRIGNFINGELWGRVTDRSIGMYFPLAPGKELRHPSQLYEAFFEGIVLFGILWFLKDRVRTRGMMLPFYLIGYGTFRFFIEYTREPDAQLGFVLFNFSMGQILCFAMILAGAAMMIVLKQREKKHPD